MTDKKTSQTRRAPVIAIMGHIDHGKSTLLDYIRKTNIVAGEAGGITQHLSAYEVEHKTVDGVESKITFLDTPGHEAFSAIRARGVHVADIAVLVVSAEDGVKPQTIEALKCIKDENIPFIVAINKIDKPEANIEKTKQNLAENEIYIEGWGGSVPAVPISAKTGQGVPELLDMMILVAELEELTGDTKKPASGIVIESDMDPQKGLSSTLIIKNGTLEKGQFVVSGEALSPVRIMENFLGQAIDSASFSTPIRIIGWSKLPKVGGVFISFDTKKEAEAYVFENKGMDVSNTRKTTEQLDGKKIVPIIIKTDTAGSGDAVIQEINKIIPDDRITVQILHAEVGAISENDVKTAMTNEESIILGFHTKIDSKAQSLSERTGVEIKMFDIIYQLTEWLTNTLKDRTPLSLTEETTGDAKILKVFNRTKNNLVVGARIQNGSLAQNKPVKIMRGETEIGRGRIEEIQQQKNKVKEVTEGEFGMMIDSKAEVAVGDIIATFSEVEK